MWRSSSQESSMVVSSRSSSWRWSAVSESMKRCLLKKGSMGMDVDGFLAVVCSLAVVVVVVVVAVFTVVAVFVFVVVVAATVAVCSCFGFFDTWKKSVIFLFAGATGAGAGAGAVCVMCVVFLACVLLPLPFFCNLDPPSGADQDTK